MKLTFGRRSSPLPASRGIGWRTLRQPDEELAMVLAVPIGASLATTLMVLWILATPWTRLVVDEWSLLAAFAFVIAAHEIAHAAAFPWSPGRPWIAFNWRHVRAEFQAGYDGELSRERLLWVQSAPLIFVSLVPLAVAAALGTAPAPVVLVTLVNALICGADALAMLLVLGQVPPRCAMLAADDGMAWRLSSSERLAMVPLRSDEAP